MTAHSSSQKVYQQRLLELNRDRQNFREIAEPDCQGEAINRTCGDRIVVQLKLDGDTIADAAYHQESCAVCRSSAALLTQTVKGMTVKQVSELLGQLKQFVTTWQLELAPDGFELFVALQKFPTRTRCLTLPWEACDAAVAKKNLK